jgi:hypothetical protein
VNTRRRRLRDIELTGTSRSLRRGSLIVVIALAATNMVLYLLEQHRDASSWSDHPSWGDPHSLIGESYFLPVLGPLLVLLAALWARRGFPRALLPAVLAGANLIVVVGCWLANHLFDTTEGTTPITTLATLATLALAATGLWLFVLEIVLPIRARSKLEREAPVFPAARVVSS